MKKIIDIQLPSSWTELTDKQLLFVYTLISDGYEANEIKTLCFFRWGGIEVIGRQNNGSYLVKRGKDLFEISPVQLAELLPALSWMDAVSPIPVRLSRIRRCKAVAADFLEVPFETFIVVDNLYQGYLQTENDLLLDDIASVLYGKSITLTRPQRISVFYWMVSLKNFFARKFPDFFQPIAASPDGNLLGSARHSVEDAMNAQIRALTKGDITKEAEILALDTWRALTELNAQAKEYKELNAKFHSK